MIRKFLLLLLIGLISNLQAQDYQNISLEDAVNIAMKNSPTIKNAQIDIADANAQIEEARAIGLPKLDGSLGYNYYIQVPKQALPDVFVDSARDPMTGELPPGFSREVSFVLRNSFTAGLSASALVYDGSYSVALRASRLYKDYAQGNLKAAEYEVRKSVMDAYLPSLLLNENTEILSKNITNLESILFETKALYKEGFVEQLDVDRLELSLANLKSELGNLNRQKEVVLNALKFTLGLDKSTQISIDDKIEDLLEEASAEELTADVEYTNRADYNSANLGLQLTELDVERWKKGYLPSVAAFANYQYQYQGDNFSDGFWAPTFVVGAQVNVPIFDGFDKRAKIERASLAVQRTQNQIWTLRNVIDLEVNNARIAYQSAQIRLEDQKKNVALAQRIYDTTQIKYKEGVGSSIEIIQAEQSLYETQANYTQALFEVLRTKIDLDKALGK